MACVPYPKCEIIGSDINSGHYLLENNQICRIHICATLTMCTYVCQHFTHYCIPSHAYLHLAAKTDWNENHLLLHHKVRSSTGGETGKHNSNISKWQKGFTYVCRHHTSMYMCTHKYIHPITHTKGSCYRYSNQRLHTYVVILR